MTAIARLRPGLLIPVDTPIAFDLPNFCLLDLTPDTARRLLGWLDRVRELKRNSPEVRLLELVDETPTWYCLDSTSLRGDFGEKVREVEGQFAITEIAMDSVPVHDLAGMVMVPDAVTLCVEENRCFWTGCQQSGVDAIEFQALAVQREDLIRALLLQLEGDALAEIVERYAVDAPLELLELLESKLCVPGGSPVVPPALSRNTLAALLEHDASQIRERALLALSGTSGKRPVAPERVPVRRTLS